jgi:hypothetical protein
VNNKKIIDVHLILCRRNIERMVLLGLHLLLQEDLLLLLQLDFTLALDLSIVLDLYHEDTTILASGNNCQRM